MAKNDRKIRRISWSIVIGCFGAVLFCVFMLWLTTESLEKSLWVAALFGAMAGVVALFVALQQTLTIYFRQRQKAFAALGKHGITVVAKDKNARLCYKGIVAFMNAKFAVAESLLMQALNHTELVQNQLFCTEWLRRLYETIDDREKFLWASRREAELAPDKPDLQCKLGQLYLTDGNLDEAYYCFEQALKYDPNKSQAYFSMAKIHMLNGEYDKAHELFDKLLKINKSHPLIYGELAVLYAAENNAEKANEICKKAILCGYKDCNELKARIAAMLAVSKAQEDDDFANAGNFVGAENAGGNVNA